MTWGYHYFRKHPPRFRWWSTITWQFCWWPYWDASSAASKTNVFQVTSGKGSPTLKMSPGRWGRLRLGWWERTPFQHGHVYQPRIQVMRDDSLPSSIRFSKPLPSKPTWKLYQAYRWWWQCRGGCRGPSLSHGWIGLETVRRSHFPWEKQAQGESKLMQM